MIWAFFLWLWAQSLPFPGPGTAHTSAATLDAAFDFRNTSGFVTDPTGYAYASDVARATWPHTYTAVGGATYKGGYNQNIGSCTQSPSGNDVANSDARLAGSRFASSVQCVAFYIVLPGAGTYNVNLAFKASASLVQASFTIYDGGGALSGLATSTTGTGGACGVATGVITWSSGTIGWTPDMVGNTITYNGNSYTVCSLTSGTVMVVTPDPTTQGGTHAWSYGAAATSLTSQTNVGIAAGNAMDTNGNLTTHANWTAASTYGGVTKSLTFATNVLQIQYGLSSGGNPFSPLSNIAVWH